MMTDDEGFQVLFETFEQLKSAMGLLVVADTSDGLAYRLGITHGLSRQLQEKLEDVLKERGILE